ncbi:MAG TPA: hypothetical protein VHF47_02800 [Acidimicrobiales bacterium]|nr:hypothetical protein [Acidimicrobiales bacterium]
MDPLPRFFCYLAAAACLALAALGGTRRGRTSPDVLVALGLLLWLAPTLWDAGTAAF